MTISVENIKVLVIIRISLLIHITMSFLNKKTCMFSMALFCLSLFSIHVGIMLIPIVLLYVPDLEYKV